MNNTLTQDQFKTKAKTWINHKIILSKASFWYKLPERRDGISHLKTLFGEFLLYPNSYSIGRLAVKIKKHEDLLMILLPNPENPSYNRALLNIKELIHFATEFITSHNLQSLIT